LNELLNESLRSSIIKFVFEERKMDVERQKCNVLFRGRGIYKIDLLGWNNCQRITVFFFLFFPRSPTEPDFPSPFFK